MGANEYTIRSHEQAVALGRAGGKKKKWKTRLYEKQMERLNNGQDTNTGKGQDKDDSHQS